jgi:multiple sugar transport system substrate-binding protein
MQWYGSTFTDGVSPRGVAVGQIPDLFANGELAMMVGNPIYIQKFSQAQGLDYGIAPQPAFANGKPVTPTDGWSLGISPYSTHQAEALRFIQFLGLDAEGTTAWSTGRSLTPANTQAFDKWIVTLAQQGGARTEGVDKLIRSELSSTAIHRPRTVGYVAFEGVMNRAFADIRNGSDPRQRLDQAQQELTAALARLKG